jgi:glycine dehydrogenase
MFSRMMSFGSRIVPRRSFRFNSNYNSFAKKHIGPNSIEIGDMLKKCNVLDMNRLIQQSLPYQSKHYIEHFEPKTQVEALDEIKTIMDKNPKVKNYIGMGFTSSILPDVIKRNILENPRWYTAYTPYQAEISQGRLEALFNYQKMITDLTGLEIANASLLDEASTGSEIVNMFMNITKNRKKTLFCSDRMHPYTLDVMATKCNLNDINMVITDVSNIDEKQLDINTLGVIFQYPDTYGGINIPNDILLECKKKGVLTACSTNLLALTELKTPGELGVDIAFGNGMNLGIPLWYGGPHPAFISCKKKYIRQMPGRIIGETVDKIGNKAYRIALQTREQHIRKEKATSNICTSQALLANVTGMYALYHGPKGLKKISKQIRNRTYKFYYNMIQLGLKINGRGPYFDTIVINDTKSESIYNMLKKENILVRQVENNKLAFTFDETTTLEDIQNLTDLIADCFKINIHTNDYFLENEDYSYSEAFRRKTEFMTDTVFSRYHTETELMRYINYLDSKDYTLCEGMMPLGSCTMKLNSATQLQPLSWDSVANVHPYAPQEYVMGYMEMIDKLSEYLKSITGFRYISYQSNSGAMGEYSGLLCIKKYHQNNSSMAKTVAIIPESAHGTNFASAKLTGLDIVKFKDTISEDDFEELVKQHSQNLSCLIVTYPGTDGVFQNNINKMIKIIHKYGGLVYMDGANMNAQVGLTSPGECGADVCHLNLHKTFCIPHGGGGPGMGPILCNDKLGKYLPKNNYQINTKDNLKSMETKKNTIQDNKLSIGNITNSQWSSASILTIPLIYIMTMGSQNLKKATEIAILNANYLKSSLENHYTIIDHNEHGRVAHEFIIDVSEYYKYGITETDISKRLIDYYFHPGTMSWPRKGVMMIEPTESESKEELDRFVGAMVSIRKEIDNIIMNYEDNETKKNSNLLKNAPHSLSLLSENWEYPYSIKEAYYPIDSLVKNKKFPAVSRVDDVYGDKKILQ